MVKTYPSITPGFAYSNDDRLLFHPESVSVGSGINASILENLSQERKNSHKRSGDVIKTSQSLMSRFSLVAYQFWVGVW